MHSSLSFFLQGALFAANYFDANGSDGSSSDVRKAAERLVALTDYTAAIEADSPTIYPIVDASTVP